MTGDVDMLREASAEVVPLNGKIDEQCGMDVRAQQDLVKSGGDCNGVSHREEDEAIEASAEVVPLNGKNDEKCGMDARAQQDLVKSGGDCNGVSHREEDEAIDNRIENGNGNGKDDAEGACVFIKGSEAVGEGVVNGFVGTDLTEESLEGKACDINVEGSEISAENGNCDVEQAAVNRGKVDGEGKLVNGENGDHHFEERIVVHEVVLVEQESNGAHIAETNEVTMVAEAETDAGQGKAVDRNDGDCNVEDHLMDNGTGLEDSRGEFIERKMAGSTAAEERNLEADIVASNCSKQHELAFHLEKQPALDDSLEVSDQISGSCDATVAASKCEETSEVPQAVEADSSGQMGTRGEFIERKMAGSTAAEEQNLEADIVASNCSKQHELAFHLEKQPALEDSLEVSDQISGSCDATVAASKCEETSEVPQADEADSSGHMGTRGEFNERKMAGSTAAEEQNLEADIVASNCSKQHELAFHLEKQPALEDSLEVSDQISGACDATVAASKCEETSEVPQADEADSSGQMGTDQKSSVEVECSLDASEKLSGPCDVIVVVSECERASEVPQDDQADSSGQVDEDQKSELKIEDSGEGQVLRIDDGAGNEDEKVTEERKSRPDIETEQNHEPESTYEVPQAEQVDSSSQVDENQKSELRTVDSGEGEVGKIDDRVGNEDEKLMEENLSCPNLDTEQNPEADVNLTKDFVLDKENSSTKMGDDSSSEAALEDISIKSDKIATAGMRAGPSSDDTGVVEPTATAPDHIAPENVEHEAVTDALDTSQEINEEAHTSENTEITPSSVSCGNVPVQIEVEEASFEENQTGIPQCVDANLEVREENDSTVVDTTSSSSATNLTAITEIFFGSISQKEISSIPSDVINAEPKVSKSLSQSSASLHTHTTECPSNDTAENESFSAQDSKLELQNKLGAVLDEKREDQCTIENDRPAFSQLEGVDLVSQNDAAPVEISSIPASEEQNVGNEMERKVFNVLIKIPRYDDGNSKQQINEAHSQVNEKTQSRDAIQAEIQNIKAACKEHSEKIEVALSEENAARELFKSKREEMESVQSVLNKVKSAITVGDYDVRIQNMEQKIQHETLPLKEEKQLVRDIKQLKHSREQLTNNMGGLDELKLALDQREQAEERLKCLRREADLLRENVLKAEAVTKSARRMYSDERDRLRELQGQFRDADKIRQDAYIHLKELRKQSYEKNKYFWKYKDDMKTSFDLASKGDREALSRFCIDQVETFMELWNGSNDFREEYLRCNAPRTLRRLGTADGRSLGPNEAMHVIPTVANQTAVKDKSGSVLPNVEQGKGPVVVEARPAADDKLPMKEVRQKKEKAKDKNSAKPVAQVEDLVTTSSSRDVVNVEIEEPKLSKEEEELAKKAEELRKAEEAAMLMEQRRLEEKAKAMEALERKKRNTERALARAASKAQKEAEQKEKEREKKAKKKERKKAGCAIAMPSDASIEGEPASSTEVTAEATADFDTKDKPAAMVKRPQKPSYFVKQTKVKPIPPTLRNRGRRKVQPWMWAILSVLLVFALFLMSNGWNLY